MARQLNCDGTLISTQELMTDSRREQGLTRASVLGSSPYIHAAYLHGFEWSDTVNWCMVE